MNLHKWIFGVGVLLGIVTALHGAELTREGRPCAEIVVSEKASAGTRQAALDLQYWLKKISGAELQIVPPSGAKADNLICVGASSVTERAGYKMPAFTGSGFDIQAKGKLVILVGPERTIRPRPVGGHVQTRFFTLNPEAGSPESDCGPAHAVTEFLETLGVRFYAPGEEGTFVPQRPTLTVPDFRRTKQAAFSRRVYRTGPLGADAETAAWFRRLNCGSSLEPTGAMPIGFPLGLMSSFQPEWSARDSFGRAMSANDCGFFPRFTSKELQQICANAVRIRFDADPSLKRLQLVLPLLRGENDADDLKTWVNRDVYPQWVNSDIMTAFFSEIAREVKKSHPDRILIAESMPKNPLPSESFRKAIPDNLQFQPRSQGAVLYAKAGTRQTYLDQLTELASLTGKPMQQHEWWNELAETDAPFQGYWFMHGLQQVRQAQQGRINGVLMEAGIDPATHRLAQGPLIHLMYYVNSKLLWDPGLDLEALLSEYYRLRFGPAAGEMKNFFQFAEETASRSAMRSLSAAGCQLTPADVAVWFELLARAKARTGSGSVYRRRIEALETACAPLKTAFVPPKDEGEPLMGEALPAKMVCNGDLSKYRTWTRVPGGPDNVRTEFALASPDDRGRLLVAFRCYEPAMKRLKQPENMSAFSDPPELLAGGCDFVRLTFNTAQKRGYTVAISPFGFYADGSSDPEELLLNGCRLGWNPPAYYKVQCYPDRWEAEIEVSLFNCGLLPDVGRPWEVRVDRVRTADRKPFAAIGPWHRFVLPMTDSLGRAVNLNRSVLEHLPGCPDETVYVVKPASGAADPVDPAKAWDSPAWKNIREMRLSWEVIWPKSSGYRPDARAKIQYDKDYLYVLYRVNDRYVRAKFLKDQSMVCVDSCMEFFVQPGKQAPYYNFECNCIGTLLLYEVTRRFDGGLKMIPVPDADMKQVKRYTSLPRSFSGETDQPTVWYLGLRIPLSLFVRRAGVKLPLSGQVWYGNVYKCADRSTHPCWLTWKKSTAYHVPDEFGTFLFE
ncbi:MAG: hypothetical protein J5806_08785 [Lentisphaeria bacterium]|nr:hypothetical protein [Lentisphaeria bacterium]